MARKPARKQAARPARHVRSPREHEPPGSPSATASSRAFMALLAEKSFEKIGFAEIAARAGVSLVDLRGEFGSTLAILAAHMKAIDRAGARRRRCRHGRGAAARAAVRRADAPHRGARRRTRRRCARCCARRRAIRGSRCALNGLAVRSQAMDADRRRHLGRPARAA